ncbi:MAG TPA: hypothetical protein VLJ86_00710 [Ramlibacter sp.]|nr:hypothetical protein [Ramlibacter sp.]
MNRTNLITVRQQAASFGVAVAVTLAVLGGLSGLADGYSAQAMQQQALAKIAETNVAVQTVVIVGKRAV